VIYFSFFGITKIWMKNVSTLLNRRYCFFWVRSW
jgi:hypothetical protein